MSAHEIRKLKQKMYMKLDKIVALIPAIEEIKNDMAEQNSQKVFKMTLVGSVRWKI